MVHHKQTLPQKTCQTCGQPFLWRKKWQRDWESVKYCSDRCRQQRPVADASIVQTAAQQSSPARGSAQRGSAQRAAQQRSASH